MNMFRYKLYGLHVESEIEIMQLSAAGEDEYFSDTGKVTIRKGHIAESVRELLADSPKPYSIGFETSFFENKYGFYHIQNGTEIKYEPKEAVSIELVKNFILGYCFAMLLLQRSTLAIHCSAVCFPKESKKEGALLIVGNSGAGKSTLTRKLIDKGFGFMADDMAAIDINEEIFVEPAFPYQKLCRNEVEANNMNQKELIYIDEDKDKYLIPVKDIFIDVPQKLLGMICIIPAEGKNVEIHKLSGIDQFLMFRNNVFMHKLKGQWENDKQFLDLCLKAAGMCPVYVITRPIGKDTADGMAEKIISLDI